MLRLLLLPAGLGLVGLALVDLLWTTLAAAAGAGPVTARIAAFSWRALRATSAKRKLDASRHGVAVVVAVLTSWIVLLLVGWLLVFSAAERAVVMTDSNVPAAFAARAYFVGYTVFTLGNGDYKPATSLWQIATVTATGTGLVLISLGITYLIPVIGAATDRRSLAGFIASLGRSPEEILVRSWNGRDFEGLRGHLEGLAPKIQEAGERHLTYPELHFFESPDRRTSAPVAIAVLHEALELLRWAIAAEVQLDAIILEPPRAAVGSFLDTVAGAFISPAREPLAPPDLDVLRAHGIPTVDRPTFLAALDAERRRRRLVAGLLSAGGWRGPATFAPPDEKGRNDG